MSHEEFDAYFTSVSNLIVHYVPYLSVWRGGDNLFLVGMEDETMDGWVWLAGEFTVEDFLDYFFRRINQGALFERAVSLFRIIEPAVCENGNWSYPPRRIEMLDSIPGGCLSSKPTRMYCHSDTDEPEGIEHYVYHYLYGT